MRAFLSVRIPGFGRFSPRVGFITGPFHPSRVGTGGSGYRDGVSLFLWLCFIAGFLLCFFAR